MTTRSDINFPSTDHGSPARKSAYLLNQETLEWTALPDMKARLGRSDHACALLDNGKIIVVGGYAGKTITGFKNMYPSLWVCSLLGCGKIRFLRYFWSPGEILKVFLGSKVRYDIQLLPKKRIFEV